jgi:hypothetical protein
LLEVLVIRRKKLPGQVPKAPIASLKIPAQAIIVERQRRAQEPLVASLNILTQKVTSPNTKKKDSVKGWKCLEHEFFHSK